ncbi:membrane protein DedA with SNARE-associated domain [Deinococcus sp. HSC-46F16]|uniref:hypothetical protein n=1 Tax=Deinococcus sp. HSC-46F16 TaxID=2910968 RepID=UPI00209E7452|nr:hypothetical protein [Deinococcus sp. HSC-46F16]MCP2015394.1 membrane protein DedA with SNARE-associated domain [Deinococcus sp. HSC-46F16]
MGIAVALVTLLLLLTIGAALWVSSGRPTSRGEREIGQIMVTVSVLGLLLTMGLIYWLGRIL